MVNVIGIDVGRNGFVAARLSAWVSNPLQHFNSQELEMVAGSLDKPGIALLQALSPNAIIMEPTGVWYSAFLREWAASIGIPVYWVGHADLSAQRSSYGFQNKRDDEDAFCLALIYFDDRFINRHGAKRFLKFEAGTVGKLRELFLENEQLDKLRNATSNQVRQRLAKEFPEACERQTRVSLKLGFSPFWGWLAGIHSYRAIEKLYQTSVSHQIGIRLTEFTRAHAKAIIELEKRTCKGEAEILTLLQSPKFQPYLKVFKRFGFGSRNQVLLLTQIYPFEKFLVNGQPLVEWQTPPKKRKAKSGTKPQKRHRSLRSFQAYLGLSYRLKQSGDSVSKEFLGSELIRSHLYMWAVDYIRRPTEEVNLSRFIQSKNPKSGHVHAFAPLEEFQLLPIFRLDTSVGHQLNRKLIELEYDGVKGTDKVLRLTFRATALLFSELCKELVPS